MSIRDSITLKGDRALGKGDSDQLGFSDVAARISTSLVDHATDDGFVIGLEGAWGSGKSSLLYLIEEQLNKLPQGKRPSIIKFRPWLLGNRDSLLAYLFAALQESIRSVELSAGDLTNINAEKAKKAGAALRNFVGGIGKLGGLVKLAGEASGLKPIEWIGSGLGLLGGLFKKKPREPTLDELKEKLTIALRELGHRFIVTIDDVDRLEPAEVIEVMRLARSVADLPNVIYLLCYDSEILCHSIEQASKVKDGRAYLEKIVQLTVMVPKPEPFQLRNWFASELEKSASTKNEDQMSRLRSVIDQEGGRQLKTPRSVVRALDSIRFFWPPLNQLGADLADLVWLHLIKDGNPKLYRWIEEYCSNASALSLGAARVDDAEKESTLNELLEIVSKNYFTDKVYCYHFADQLFGVEVNYGKDGNPIRVHQKVTKEVRDAKIRDRRLASPDHYRLYFALMKPSHALSQGDFEKIWEASSTSSEETATVLLAWQCEKTAGSLTKADVFLERLKGIDPSQLKSTQIQNFLNAFSNLMDDAYRQGNFTSDYIFTIWDRAEILLPALLSKIDEVQRENIIRIMFGKGRAIGWLTSLFRSEVFAHGRYGDRLKPVEGRLLSETELNVVSELMLKRYSSMSFDEVLAVPSPLSLLFAWRQGGDEEGPKNLISINIKTDEALLRTLEALSSTVTSSGRGKYEVLKRGNLEPFLDYDLTKERINELALGDTGDPMTLRAKNFQTSFEDGVEF
jgi:predicted KAP-like P-loop ATPase